MEPLTFSCCGSRQFKSLNQDWIPTGTLWDMDNYKGHCLLTILIVKYFGS